MNIPVATATSVVKVPNAALRFRPPLPPETVRALEARAGIDADAVEGSGGDSAAAPTKHQHPAESAVVWKLQRDGEIAPVQLSLGITDHAYTQLLGVTKGTLATGDDLVTTAIVAKGSSGPGGPGARR